MGIPEWVDFAYTAAVRAGFPTLGYWYVEGEAVEFCDNGLLYGVRRFEQEMKNLDTATVLVKSRRDAAIEMRKRGL